MVRNMNRKIEKRGRPLGSGNRNKTILGVRVTDEEFAARRKEEMSRGDRAFTPHSRSREISKALKAYSRLVSSAGKGAIRIVD